MSKNVAVFVDVANIFYAAKAAGVDIDYVTLLKASTAGRDFVRAYAYTGLDPENENQRQFHSFLGRSGYKVVSKDIRKYGDGRIKANLDIELVVDMMRMAQHIDIAVVVSGDGDFAPAIRAVQQQGVRVEVVSFRGNTSSDLIEVADVFTDISQLARVEKGERSGRRVASEDDLSMTAVPEKETDNGVRRRRGEGRRTERPEHAERAERPASGTERPARGTRGPVVDHDSAIASTGNLIVLPGERLSRVTMEDAEADGSDGYPALVEAEVDAGAGEFADGGVPEPETEGDGRRRRRRRGGRGRGRGRRGEGEGETAGAEPGEPGRPTVVSVPQHAPDALDAPDLIEDEYLEEEVATLPQHSTFGSVWESQLGVAAPSSAVRSVDDQDGYDDEPEIPEYLLAERRQQGRGRGGRDQRPGGRGAPGSRGAGGPGYRTAVDRERYGRSGAPAGGFGGGSTGGNRQDRGRGGQQAQGARGPAPARQPRPVSSEPRERFERTERPAASTEPWSEVPAEVQELLRAELARRQPGARAQATRSIPAPAPTAPAGSSAGRSRRAPRAAASAEAAVPARVAEPPAEAPATAKAPAKPRARASTVAPPAAVETAAEAPATAKAPAKPRARASIVAPPAAVEAAAKAPARAKAAAKPRAKTATSDAPAAVEAAAPKATRRRSTAATTTGTGEG